MNMNLQNCSNLIFIKFY